MNEGRLKHAGLLFTAEVRRGKRRRHPSVHFASAPGHGHKSRSRRKGCDTNAADALAPPMHRLCHRLARGDFRNRCPRRTRRSVRSEEHTSELQSLMRLSYAVFCLKKKKYIHNNCTIKE